MTAFIAQLQAMRNLFDETSTPEEIHGQLLAELLKPGPMDKTLIIAGIALLAAMAKSKSAQAPANGISYLDQPGAPRGIRNNNPGNLRIGEPWRGKIGQDTAGFVRFKDYIHGTRAAIKVLQTYYNRHGLRTWEQVANRWAPTSDGNQPQKYAQVLQNYTGQSAFDLQPDTLYNAMRAITAVENGTQYATTITPEIFNAALAMT